MFLVLLRWFSPLYGPHEQSWIDPDTSKVVEFHLEIQFYLLLAFEDTWMPLISLLPLLVL